MKSIDMYYIYVIEYNINTTIFFHKSQLNEFFGQLKFLTFDCAVINY